jgi:ubiquitin-conjugating enzyme E2 J2
VVVRMAERACVQRLQKEFRAMCKEPVPHILARPSHSDIREWHYVLEGSEGTPFEGLLHIVFEPLLPWRHHLLIVAFNRKRLGIWL